MTRPGGPIPLAIRWPHHHGKRHLVRQNTNKYTHTDEQNAHNLASIAGQLRYQ